VIRNILFFLCAISLTSNIFSQRVIYKARTFIAPRKYVEDEVPPEKKRPKSYTNVCAKYSAEKKENVGDPVLNDAVVSFLPKSDFRKSDSTYFTKDDFFYAVNSVEAKVADKKTICVRQDDELFAPYDPKKAKLEKAGPHSVTVVVIDNEGNFSPEYKFGVHIDRTPPELEIILDGAALTDSQQINCKNGSRIEMGSSDRGHRLTHIFYRHKSDEAWSYYHKPILIESDGDFSLEAKSVDFAGNESKSFAISCRGGH